MTPHQKTGGWRPEAAGRRQKAVHERLLPSAFRLPPSGAAGLVLFTLLAVLTWPAALRAQFTRPEIFRDIGMEQHLDQQAPLDVAFLDETGKSVKLRQFFGAQPVVLAMVYFNCPMLCPMALDGLVKSLRQISLDPGKDFQVLAISFNPRETPQVAAAKKAKYLADYGRPGAAHGWHFLTGEDSSIFPLAKAVGFHYLYDANTGQYAHASGMIVLTPEGKVSRYFYGIEYLPRDMRLGLVEASGNKIGTRTDQALLYCLHYDPTTGKYGVLIMRLIRIAGLLTVAAIGTMLFVFFRRERRT